MTVYFFINIAHNATNILFVVLPPLVICTRWLLLLLFFTVLTEIFSNVVRSAV
jgi:hypothetical protein